MSNPKKKMPARDANGHFVSAGGKTAKPKTAKPKTKVVDDDSVVKIKIIRDEQPKIPSSFEGHLENEKERVASSFIKAVKERKPRSINIDGAVYYGENVLLTTTEELERDVEDLRKKHEESAKKGRELIATLLATGVTVAELSQEFRRKAIFWRRMAIGLTQNPPPAP